MRRAVKRWLGFGLALLVAGWLATFELREPPPEEWVEVDLPLDDDPLDPGPRRLDLLEDSEAIPSASTPAALDVSVAFDAAQADVPPQPVERVTLATAAASTLSQVTATADSRGVELPGQSFDEPPGVELQGGLEADPSGHFVATPAALLLFESYYRSFAPQSDDLIRGRLVLHVLDTLPPRAADEAIEVLDRWRKAERAAGSLEHDPSPAELRALREEFLGAELTAALYGEG